MYVLFPALMNLKLEPLEEYLETTERFLESHRASIEALPAPPPPDDDLYVDDYHNASVVFPNLLHSSVFVDAVALLEIGLHRFCLRVQREANMALAPKDLTGKGIYRSRLYLTRAVHGFPFPPDNSLWQELTQLSELRNRILHNEASLIGAEAAFRAWVTGHAPKLSVVEDSVVVTAAFCTHAIATIRAFGLQFPVTWTPGKATGVG